MLLLLFSWYEKDYANDKIQKQASKGVQQNSNKNENSKFKIFKFFGSYPSKLPIILLVKELDKRMNFH